MGYIIPAGYSRATFEYDARSPMGSQLVWGIGLTQGPTETMLDALQDWWEDSGKIRTSLSYTLSNIELRNDIEVLNRSVGTNGSLTDAPAPPGCAALVRLGSGLVGRKNRGRIYLPGMLLDDDIDSDGSILSGTVLSIQGVVDDLMAAIASASATPVVLHSDVGTPTLVTSAQVQSVSATQRRRLRR